jgi:hypothetical protein
MTTGIRRPSNFYGSKFKSVKEVVTCVEEFLCVNAGISGQRVEFRNAGHVIGTLTATGTRVIVLVPVPHLDLADVTTGQLQSAVAEAIPPGYGLHVKVAPPDADERYPSQYTQEKLD